VLDTDYDLKAFWLLLIMLLQHRVNQCKHNSLAVSIPQFILIIFSTLYANFVYLVIHSTFY